MSSRSRLLHHLLLLIAAVAVFAISAWVAMRAIEPVPSPLVPPAKSNVSFDSRVDVRNHPLFGTLQALTRGKVMPDILGRANPFLSAGGGIEALQEGAESLGTIEEVSLGGSSLVALSKGAEHGVLVLLEGAGQGTYEVQRLSGTESPQSVGSWVLDSSDAALRPVALQEDRSGTVWLLSAAGRIGSLQGDGRPLWGSLSLNGIQTTISSARASFALDGAGRLWLTEGGSVFVGNGIGFERIDLSAQLSVAHRQALGAPAEGDLPADLRAPERLQMLSDGRMAVLTKRFMAVFPLNLQGEADVTVSPGVAIAVEPDGALWSVVRGTDGAVQRWVRTVADGAREYTDVVVLPKQAADTAQLAAVNTATLYALDYVPGATVLWNVLSTAWVAQVLSPQGVQPQDRAERLVADRDGNVWAALSQRGLLLIHPSR